MDYDPIKTCPYNPSHRVNRSRMGFHKMKCSKHSPIQNQVDSEDKSHCRARESTIMPTIHHTISQPEPKLLQSEGVSDEDWDKDTSGTYKPLEAIKDRFVPRIPIGLSKGQKKQHKTMERLRFEQLKNEQQNTNLNDVNMQFEECSLAKEVVHSIGYKSENINEIFKIAVLHLIVLLPNRSIKCCCCNEILNKRLEPTDIINHIESYLHTSRLKSYCNIKVDFTDDEFSLFFNAGIALSISSLDKLWNVTNRGYKSCCYKCCTIVENSKMGIIMHIQSKKHCTFSSRNMQQFCYKCYTVVSEITSHKNSEFHKFVQNESVFFGHVTFESYLDIDEDDDEESLLESVPSIFDSPQHYRKIFKALINHVKKSQKKIVRSQFIKDVTVEWVGEAGEKHQPKGYFEIPAQDDTSFPLKLGDELVITRTVTPLWTMTCRLIQVYDNNKMACIQLKNGIGFRKDIQHPYSLHKKWSDTAYWRMQQGISKIYKIPNFIDVLLGNKKLGYRNPPMMTEFDVNCIESTHNYCLNAIQMDAVKMALQEPMSIIHGPPGTGKTSVCISIICTMIRHEDNIRILVCAPSNYAVDGLAENLEIQGIEIVRLYPERYKYNGKIKNFSLLHMALAKDKYLEQNYEAYEKHEMKDEEYNKYHSILYETMSKILSVAKVVLTTCIGSATEEFKHIRYDVVLIDEAAQATEPESVVPFVLHQATKVILAGDHFQLGPIVMSKISEKCGFGFSLFEKLMNQDIPNTLLQIQYRMAPTISKLASTVFYDNKLIDGIRSFQRILSEDLSIFKEESLVFINLATKEKNFYKSYLNLNEARCVIYLLSLFMNQNVMKPEQIGVISCYEGQKKAIMELIETEQDEEMIKKMSGVKIENVDAFQGREKDIIIFSAVRANSACNVGFMSNKRRTNVALTRAKFKCFVIGDVRTLQSDETWCSVIQYCRTNQCLYNGEYNEQDKVFTFTKERNLIGYSHIN